VSEHPAAARRISGTVMQACTRSGHNIGMNGGEAMARMVPRAEAAGLVGGQADFFGRPSVIARRSDFKAKWFATRLHTFLVASAFDHVPDVAELDAFLDAAREYAVSNKGGLPRGLQTGVAVIAAAVVPGAAPGLDEWALTPHARRFAAIPFPVLANLATGAVAEPRRMLLGGIYAGHLRGITTTSWRLPSPAEHDQGVEVVW